MGLTRLLLALTAAAVIAWALTREARMTAALTAISTDD